MKSVVIDHNKCNKDLLCVKICPFNLLETTPEGLVQWRPSAAEFCIECGQCLAVCPQDALSLNGVCGQDCQPSAQTATPQTAQTLEGVIKSRRSIRRFSAKAVQRNLIESLVDLTAWAPTGKNRNSVCWKLTDDKEKIQRLAGLVSDWMLNVPVLKAIGNAYKNGTDMILRDAPVFVATYTPDDAPSATHDSTIALAEFELAATANGLGTCWAGFVMMAAQHSKAIADLLEIPQGHSLCGGMMVGYSAYTYHRVPPRPEPHKHWI